MEVFLDPTSDDAGGDAYRDRFEDPGGFARISGPSNGLALETVGGIVMETDNAAEFQVSGLTFFSNEVGIAGRFEIEAQASESFLSDQDDHRRSSTTCRILSSTGRSRF